MVFLSHLEGGEHCWSAPGLHRLPARWAAWQRLFPVNDFSIKYNYSGFALNWQIICYTILKAVKWTSKAAAAVQRVVNAEKTIRAPALNGP